MTGSLHKYFSITALSIFAVVAPQTVRSQTVSPYSPEFVGGYAQSSDDEAEQNEWKPEVTLSLLDRNKLDFSKCSKLGMHIGPFQIADRTDYNFCELSVEQVAANAVGTALLDPHKTPENITKLGLSDTLSSFIQECRRDHVNEQRSPKTKMERINTCLLRHLSS
jgi:hypothetical protein